MAVAAGQAPRPYPARASGGGPAEQVADTGASPVPSELDGIAYASRRGRRATVYAPPADDLLADRVRDLLDGLPGLPGLPEALPTGVHAVLAHSSTAFDQATGGVVPEWGSGAAIPMLDLLVVPIGEGVRVTEGEGLRTLRHEWAHLALQQHLGDLRVPRWFHEGYAQWASGGFETSEAWRLRVLIAVGRAPAMDSLELRWPARRPDARTAYLLAATAVAYLLEGSGEGGLAIFLDRWKAERSFEVAFRETFGLTTRQFEEDWRGHVKRRYGWLFVLSHSAVFWLLLSLVLLFLMRGREGRNRERLARLRAKELPDAPAFWHEPDGDVAAPGIPRDPLDGPAG
jgi:hypothetical protein